VARTNFKQNFFIITFLFLFVALFTYLPLWAQTVFVSKSFGEKNAPPSINTAKPEETTGVSQVPILMYHHIRVNQNPNDKIGQGLSVSPEMFEQQMKLLKDNGYQTISLADIFQKENEKRFIITFDDGYKDVLSNALPILKKYGFFAVVFPIVDFVGHPDYLSWEDIALLKQEGWEVGSHTLAHPNLTGINDDWAKKEISESKKIFDEKLSQNTILFCYPSGEFNDKIIQFVRDAGYQYAVTTQPGPQNTSQNTLKLNRIRVSENEGLFKQN